MVFRLLPDVGAHRLQPRCAHGEGPESRLPCEFSDVRVAFLNSEVGAPLELLHQIRLGYAATQLNQKVDMIGNTADHNGRAVQSLGNPSEESVNLLANTIV